MADETHIIDKPDPVQRILQHVDAAMRGRSKLLNVWRKDWQMYQSYIDMDKRDQRRSNAFIPLVFPLVESATARYMSGLFGVDPMISVMPASPEFYLGATRMQQVQQYYLEKMGIFIPMSDISHFMLIFGDGFGLLEWRVKVEEMEEDVPIMDMGVVVGYEQQVKPVVTYDAPYLTSIAPWQVLPDGDTTVDRCNRIVIEDYVRIEDLKDLERQGKVRDIDKLSPTQEDPSQTRSEQMSRWSIYKDIGYDCPKDTEGYVQVYKMYQDDNWQWLADGHTLILDDDNKHHHKKKPIIQFPKVPQVQRFFSMSAIRPAARLQNLYNTVVDQMVDRNNQTVNPWILFRAGVGIDRNRLVSRPNNTIEVHGDPSSALYVHEPGQMTGDPGAFLQFIKGAFDEATGYYGYQRGEEQRKRTATEANILSQGGDQRIRYDMMVYEHFGMSRLAELMGADIQQWMPAEVSARIAGYGGFQFERITPEDIRGQFDYKFLGTTSSYNRDVDRAQLIEMFNLMANSPEINRWGFIDAIVDAVPALRDRKENLLNPPAPMGMPGGMPGMGGQPPVESIGAAGQAVVNPNTMSMPATPGQAAQQGPRPPAVGVQRV